MDSAKMVKLADISELITKGTTPTALGYEFQEDGVKFLKIECFNEQGGFIPDKVTYISEECNEKLKRSQIKENDILFSIAGAIGRVAIATREMIPANTNQALAIIRIREGEAYIPYLKLILTSKIVRDQFEKQKQGVAQLNLSLKNIGDLEVPICSLEKQKKFVDLFSKIQDAIDNRKQELEQLDILIKARFVEMFGDPEINSKNLPVIPMTETCEIIDGDRGKNYPTQDDFLDEGYCLFLNAKNVTTNGFSFENCMFVTKEKDEILRKGHLNRGDIVLTTRGTIGNLAFYDDSVPFENVRINSGMVILRMNHDIVTEYFFIEQFKMQLASIKERIASGSAQPQLPISIMNKIMVLMPDVRQQEQFADFVKQVDKSKLAVQKSLEKTQQLFDSLMQEYFG